MGALTGARPAGRRSSGRSSAASARLLERGLAEELHGDVSLEFLPTGVLCTVDAPLDA